MTKLNKQVWYDIIKRVEALTSEEITALINYCNWLIEHRVASVGEGIQELDTKLRSEGKLK